MRAPKIFPLFITLVAGVSATAQTGGDTLRRIVEVTVSGKEPERVEVGAVGCKRSTSMSMPAGGEMVAVVKPPRAGMVEAVRLDVPTFFRGDGQVHLVAYTVDERGWPGEQLFDDSTLVIRTAGGRHRWLDIRDKGLQVDTAGVYLGVRWPKREYNREEGTSNALRLIMTTCPPAMRTVSRIGDGPWGQMQSPVFDDVGHLDLSATFRLYP